jgi:hypothetical protein
MAVDLEKLQTRTKDRYAVSARRAASGVTWLTVGSRLYCQHTDTHGFR